MKGNPITYYDKNFNARQKNPEIQSDFVYAIWYPQSSGWCYQYYLASFKTMDQLVKFSELLDFTFEFDEEKKQGFCNKTIYHEFKDRDIEETVNNAFNMAFHSESQSDKNIGRMFLNHHFEEKCFAYNINSENLESAKSFKSLSNGHIVDNLFISDKEEVRIYRCNPNAKDFYIPLSLEEHIKFSKENGSY